MPKKPMKPLGSGPKPRDGWPKPPPQHRSTIERKLNGIFWALLHMQGRINRMAGEFDALRAAVARNTDVDQSAIVLLQGLKEKLDAAIAAGDPAAIQALADELGAKNQALADAVTANTPAA